MEESTALVKTYLQDGWKGKDVLLSMAQGMVCVEHVSRRSAERGVWTPLALVFGTGGAPGNTQTMTDDGYGNIGERGFGGAQATLQLQQIFQTDGTSARSRRTGEGHTHGARYARGTPVAGAKMKTPMLGGVWQIGYMASRDLDATATMLGRGGDVEEEMTPFGRGARVFETAFGAHGAMRKTAAGAGGLRWMWVVEFVMGTTGFLDAGVFAVEELGEKTDSTVGYIEGGRELCVRDVRMVRVVYVAAYTEASSFWARGDVLGARPTGPGIDVRMPPVALPVWLYQLHTDVVRRAEAVGQGATARSLMMWLAVWGHDGVGAYVREVCQFLFVHGQLVGEQALAAWVHGVVDMCRCGGYVFGRTGVLGVYGGEYAMGHLLRQPRFVCM